MNKPDVLIVHVSDLHFGSTIHPLLTVGPKGSLASYLAPQGLFPHDFGAAQELKTELTSLIRSTTPRLAILVVSGDLTITGASSEFVNALTFLHERLGVSYSRRLGLKGLFNDVMAIPGNHDHWKGSYWGLFGNRPASQLHGTYFVGPSGQDWWHEVRDTGSLQVQVMGIDSTGASKLHFAATGSVVSTSLTALDQQIAAANAKAAGPIIRVLTVHHSISQTATWTHELDPQSLADVNAFCARNEIHFVLTGHTHRHLVPAPGTPHGFGTELRCGTTLQGAPPGKMPSRDGQIFLAHAAKKGRAGVEWETTIYQRTSTSGSFVEVKSPRYKVVIR
jgi:3',5'-cyclic AMP phosphodiesterase CpdA